MVIPCDPFTFPPSEYLTLKLSLIFSKFSSIKMFVLDYVTPPYIFTPLNHHPVTPPMYSYPENPYKPQKPSQKNIVKNPLNPEMEPIQIANGSS
jgi:hypothetical protein